jgi:hypothetical protein
VGGGVAREGRTVVAGKLLGETNAKLFFNLFNFNTGVRLTRATGSNLGTVGGTGSVNFSGAFVARGHLDPKVPSCSLSRPH